MKSLLLFTALLPAVLANVNFPFSQTLREDAYTISWNFNIENETIYFMISARTTGWVGFGLSPDGGMANSDVVIGWVDDSGNPFFHDRFADAQSRPPVDDSQDWFLISGEESNGYTTLVFSRNWTTCDDRDREITAQTARVIYSWSDSDPQNNDPMAVMYHGRDNRGSASVNLLGGLPDPPPEPEDSQSFFLGVENFEIPSDTDTTYWCLSVQIPEEVLAGTHYIYKYSPLIQENNTAFVHHIIVYQCGELVNGTSTGSCRSELAANPLTECDAGGSLAGWAVGGGDFIFPTGVGYRVSGPGRGHFVVMEMHYDNPELVSGVFDNSGIQFFYTARRPMFEAGQLTIGTSIEQNFIIPPQAENYTVIGRCPIGCTQQNLPATGIKIFANFFHTHLAGHGLVLEHYRVNPDCGVLEQLQPIDINLQYDFNYQQNTILPREVTVLPGDILLLKCFYRTMDRNFITLGGEATRDEMCFAFPYFYPDLSDTAFTCGSIPTEGAFDRFIDMNVPQNLQSEFRDITRNINSQNPETRPSREEVRNTFGQLSWTPELTEELEDSLLSGDVYSFCLGYQSGLLFETNSTDPQPTCAYEAPNVCTDEFPLPCCERIGDGGAIKLAVNIILVFAAVCLTAVFSV